MPAMTEKRGFFSLVAFNGTVFAVGGKSNTNDRLNSVEYYDIFDDKWKYVSPMNRERSSFGAVVHKSRLLVFGGIAADGSVNSSAEYYDISINKWIPVSKFSNTTNSIQCISMVLMLTPFPD